MLALAPSIAVRPSLRLSWAEKVPATPPVVRRKAPDPPVTLRPTRSSTVVVAGLSGTLGSPRNSPTCENPILTTLLVAPVWVRAVVCSKVNTPVSCWPRTVMETGIGSPATIRTYGVPTAPAGTPAVPP